MSHYSFCSIVKNWCWRILTQSRSWVYDFQLCTSNKLERSTRQSRFMYTLRMKEVWLQKSRTPCAIGKI